MEVNTNLISHTGTIKSINNQHLVVKIISQTACAACHAKGACTSSDQSEKEIEIRQFDGEFSIGEEVLIIATSEQGYKAIFYAYILPLFILVMNLLILLSIIKDEALAALGSILLLSPYFLILFLLRNRIKSSFNFTIKKMPNTTL